MLLTREEMRVIGQTLDFELGLARPDWTRVQALCLKLQRAAAATEAREILGKRAATE